MLTTCIILGILIVGIKLLRSNKKKGPKKVFGVYSQPGEWYILKYYAFLLLMTIRRLKYYVFGKKIFHNEASLEKLQPLSSHKLAFDAVFFQAVSQDGIYFCCGTERRQAGKINGLVYLVLPEYGLLLSEKLPKTTLDADPASMLALKTYAAEGISLTPVKPMKEWHISFKGKMRQQSKPENFLNVELDAEWKSNYPWFLFEVDMPSKLLAKAIAREPWTERYFQNLRDAHQSHYEQMGYLSGTLKVNGKSIPFQDLDAFRDHSYGFKRDWSLMHRYIYHMFYLSNGTKISVGVVCQPCTSSYLEMGFVTYADGKMEAVESCDLLIYQHAENGILPKELCFTFVTGGITNEAVVMYEYDVVHFVGNDTEAKMNERFLSCVVNGVPGRGISEWHYNNCKL